MEISKKEIIILISGAILSTILANLGTTILKDFPERPMLGLTTIIFAFILIYFLSYILDIKNIQNKIEEIEKAVDKKDKERKIDKKLLNKIYDIVILEETRGKIK